MPHPGTFLRVALVCWDNIGPTRWAYSDNHWLSLASFSLTFRLCSYESYSHKCTTWFKPPSSTVKKASILL